MLSTSVLPSKTFNYHVVLSMTGNAVQRLGVEALSIGSGGKSKPQEVALLLQFCIVSKESTESCAYLQGIRQSITDEAASNPPEALYRHASGPSSCLIHSEMLIVCLTAIAQ